MQISPLSAMLVHSGWVCGFRLLWFLCNNLLYKTSIFKSTGLQWADLSYTTDLCFSCSFKKENQHKCVTSYCKMQFLFLSHNTYCRWPHWMWFVLTDIFHCEYNRSSEDFVWPLINTITTWTVDSFGAHLFFTGGGQINMNTLQHDTIQCNAKQAMASLLSHQKFNIKR